MLREEFSVPVPPFPQGEPGFIEDLKSYDPRRAHWNTQADIPEEVYLLSGKWQINKSFPDPENLLDTAYSAIERFAAANVPESERQIKITSQKCDTLGAEEYSVSVTPEGVFLRASDTEGLRRAVYFFIDMCRSSKVPALKFQEITRKPWLKNRISRCFFGPIKRPPFYRDELTDDIDYYPEPYLDRLASEGVNGIWLTIVWKELAETEFFPVDELRAKRIEKLKRTVEKCRRYGIKVWVFCIEPASWNLTSTPPFEDMRGKGNVGNAFCIASENSQKYVTESVYSIFRDTPNLGGMMLISLGERPTSCLSFLNYINGGVQDCNCECGLSHGGILNKVLSCIRAGIKKAGSDAQVLSWLYNPLANQISEWWFTIPEAIGGDHILAFNFESGCSKKQDGKVVSGGDYWLSSIGPSDRFGRIAAAAKGHCELAAKIQVGCSHELATIPFMPVPGNLYEKYRAMKRLGVTNVIQCWYFGNYPGLMNRAAGMLAFEDFKLDQHDFLHRLALPDWGAAHAEKAARMWQDFGNAYSNYPMDIQFQYYGPMHDGVVWPLHLKQVMKSLPRSWKPDTAPAGDAIGECLCSFKLTNAVTLSQTLAGEWSRAAGGVSELRKAFSDDPARQRDCDLYEALDILFNSGARILQFYHLRSRLFDAPKGSKKLLLEMKRIVEAEKAASARMIELCGSDSRLGYHSEAEVFKFYPEKLAWRISQLETLAPLFDELLAATPQEAARMLEWSGTEFKLNTRYRASTFEWECRVNELGFEIEFENAPLPSGSAEDQQFVLLMDEKGTEFPQEFGVHDEGTPYGYNDKSLGIEVEHISGTRRIARVPLSKLNYAEAVFIGVLRRWRDAGGTYYYDTLPAGDGLFDPRLNFNGLFSADKLGKLFLE
ncbi:MAG: hypothetical protein E7045_06025 [Lentisphaerae bacterium]|nr:hypothetical protein [Lentisphaerota bacterium]